MARPKTYPYDVMPDYAFPPEPEIAAAALPDPALRTYHAALANRAYARVKIVAMGDTLTAFLAPR